MNNKALSKVASLIMAFVMIVGNTITTRAATTVPLIAGSSIYWGAMVEGKVPSSTNLQGVFNTFETRSGKRMSIIHWGQPWVMSDGSSGEFQTTYFENVRSHGSIPMLNWTSWRLGAGTNQSNFQLRDIYNGTYDPYIRRWATDAKNWGHPFFLRFNHEGNGWWYPWGEGKTDSGAIVNGNSAGDFVRAWRHVHDIFTSVGATNVTWLWSLNHMSTSNHYPALSTLYPGDAYVDWTGLSVYNKYPTWAGLNPLMTGSQGMTWFRNSYNDVLNVAPNKPMMLAEFGSFEAGDGGAKKAAWITDALTVQIPTNFPKLKAVVWMNWDVNEGRTYPIETSQAATNAWAAGIGSSIYASNQFSNLNTSPIPSPNGTNPLPPPSSYASAGTYDDGNANWAYAGSWLLYNASGPYNNSLHYTLTTGNLARFAFNGTQFILTYTQDTNRANYDVYVDGNRIATINANGAFQWQKTYTSPVFSWSAHIVEFRNAGGGGGVMDVDAIRILEPAAVGAGTYDDGNTNWGYAGSWLLLNSSGPYNNSLHYTFTAGNSARFRFNGTQFILTYTQDTNRANYDIYIDGNRIGTINANGAFQWRKTYTSPVFSSGTHTVEFRNMGGGGGVMDVDAIQILATAAPGAGTYDDGNTNWAYTGSWLLYNAAGPQNSTLHYTFNAGNTARFAFTGTQFILTYTQDTNRANYEVYIDGNRIATINANGAFQWQKTYSSPVFSSGTHTVEFRNMGGAGGVMDVDAIEVR